MAEKDFPNITEYAPDAGEKFFDYYSQATSAGHLTEREKALIALAVATVRHRPIFIHLTLNNSNPEILSLPITVMLVRQGQDLPVRVPWKNPPVRAKCGRGIHHFHP